MFRSILLAVALAFGIVSAAGAAGEDQIPPPATALATQFFTLLQDEKYPEAFHFAFKDLEKALGSSNVDAAAISIQDFTKSFGTVTSWTVARVRLFGPDYVEVTYRVNYEAVPIFYTLQFYNPGKGWRIIDVKANTLDKARSMQLVDQ